MSSMRGRGVTLIELMIGLVVMVILISLVGPSFQRMIQLQRLRSINSQLVTDLEFARSEAAARNAYLRITFRNDATMTCYTMYTYSNNGTQCNCLVTPSCTAADQTEIKTVRVPADSKVTVKPIGGQPIEFAFDPITGSLYAIPSDFGPTTLSQYTIRVQIDSERKLNTIVGAAGRPSVCAPSGSTVSEPAC